RAATFLLIHSLFGLGLLVNVTPWRESLQSWIWRGRGPFTRLHDLWRGDRSENGLALATLAVLGIVNLVLFVLLPVAAAEGLTRLVEFTSDILTASAGAFVVFLALGSLLQWCVAVGGRPGRSVFLTMAVILIVPLHVVGWYYHLNILLALSASAQFASWLGLLPVKLSLVPLLIFYGLLLAGTRFLLHGY